MTNPYGRRPRKPRANAYARKLERESSKKSTSFPLAIVGILCAMLLAFCASQVSGSDNKDDNQTSTPTTSSQTSTTTSSEEPTTEETTESAEPTTTSRKPSSLFAPLDEDDEKHYTPKPRTHIPDPPAYEEPNYAPEPDYVPPQRSTGGGVVKGGAYCDGGTGVTKKGTPMVCAPGSDGKNRWQKAG